MALIPGFDYDIYISYSQMDNSTFPGQENGWIKQFYEHLNLMLAKRFGRMDIIKFWWDPNMPDGNTSFDEFIDKAIKKSAIMICMNSHAYMNSEYCKKELELFYNKAKGEKPGLVIGNQSRIINVQLSNIPYSEWPEELGDTVGFSFHDALEPDDLGDLVDITSDIFRKQIRYLRDSIYQLLIEFQNEQENRPVVEESIDGAVQSEMDRNYELNSILFESEEISADRPNKQRNIKRASKHELEERINDIKTEDPTAKHRLVFISYNHEDQEIAFKIRDCLKQEKIDVIIDADDMAIGMEIPEFINESVRKADTIISLISDKSLQSSWVGMETATTFMNEKFADNKKYIACYLDEKFFEDEYTLTVVDNIDNQINEKNELIAQFHERRLDTRSLSNQITRLYTLRNNIDETIRRLRESLTLDIRENTFDNSMNKLVRSIRQQQN